MIWDTTCGTIAALKKQPAKSESAARELNTYHSLPQHPNVLSILDAFVGRGQWLYLVFRYHNSCLEVVWRAAQGCLEWAEARRYCGHVFAGLRHLHAHDVCHRDLCFANLLLSFRDNIVQIADLGLAACAASFTLERNVTQLVARSRSSCFYPRCRRSGVTDPPAAVCRPLEFGHPRRRLARGAAVVRGARRADSIASGHRLVGAAARRMARLCRPPPLVRV